MNFWAYVDTFHILSWIFILLMVLLLSFAYTFIPMFNIETLHENIDSEKFNILNGIGLVVLIVLQRDYPISKNHLASRILFSVTCFFGFLFFAYYSAVLTSLMTSKAAPVPIRSFQDVLDLDKDVIVWEKTSNEAALK